MKISASTMARAKRAADLFKQLAKANFSAGASGYPLVLPNGREFRDRQFDECFESGDGGLVVVSLMRLHREDAELREAFLSPHASRHVGSDWAQKLAEWEASQDEQLALQPA